MKRLNSAFKQHIDSIYMEDLAPFLLKEVNTDNYTDLKDQMNLLRDGCYTQLRMMFYGSKRRV